MDSDEKRTRRPKYMTSKYKYFFPVPITSYVREGKQMTYFESSLIFEEWGLEMIPARYKNQVTKKFQGIYFLSSKPLPWMEHCTWRLPRAFRLSRSVWNHLLRCFIANSVVQEHCQADGKHVLWAFARGALNNAANLQGRQSEVAHFMRQPSP